MKTKRTRLTADTRRDEIERAALSVAERNGYNRLTREDVATEAAVSPSLVSHYMGTVGEMEHRVIRRAIRDGNLQVIAQAVTNRHALVQGPLLTDTLRDATLLYISKQM
jgi:AcrR family transcriptional regulator